MSRRTTQTLGGCALLLVLLTTGSRAMAAANDDRRSWLSSVGNAASAGNLGTSIAGPVGGIVFAGAQFLAELEARNGQGQGETGKPTFIGMVGNVFLQVQYWILSGLMWIGGVLLSLAGKFLDVILSVKKYADVPLVIQGWKFVRDVMNFVFIFVLLAIAFSTIAGLESFQARRALPKLVFAALLINFSLGIGGAINGVATCVMNTAISSLADPNVNRGTLTRSNAPSESVTSRATTICGGGNNLGTRLVTAIGNSAAISKYYGFGPSTLARFAGFDIQTFSAQGPLSDQIDVFGKAFDANLGAFLGAASAVLFISIFIAALVVFVILFFIRTVILLMLLILSPIPYAVGLIPAAQGYARQWWEQFLKYVIYGPVTILLLVLVVSLLGNGQGGTASGVEKLFSDLGGSTAALGGGQATQNVATSFANAAFSTTFISFYLIATILIGLKLGIVGAGMATSLAGRVARGAAYYGGVVPALGAGRLGLKAAGSAAAGVGTLAARLPGVSAGLGLLRRGGRAFTRPFTGKNFDEQIAERQKELKRYDTQTLDRMSDRGDAAAGKELLERDKLDTPERFRRAIRNAPARSKLREDLQQKFEVKAPATAILGTTDVGRAGAATADEQQRIQRAMRRMKPEDFAQLSADEFKAVRAASKISGSAVTVPMTQAQATAAVNSTNVDLQDEVKDYIEKELRDISGAPKAGLKPALASLEHFARTKLKI